MQIYLSYQEAKEFVSKLGLKNQREWLEYARSRNKPDNIPSNPNSYYKNKDWLNLGDFLGTGYIATKNRKYISYQEAKEFVSKLGIRTTNEWKEYVKSGKKPDNIPSNLKRTYKNQGWISIGEFLGTGNVHGKFREYLPYEEAKEFVSKLNIKNGDEWIEYCKSGNKPDNIPNDPFGVYKRNNQWISWGDFLGTNFIAPYKREYLSYEEAKEFVHKLNLKGQKEWKQYCKSENKPNNIPANPYGVYEDKGWKSWGDFLGNGNIATFNREYVSFQEAREFVIKLGFKGKQEWEEYVKSGKKPHNIPAKPEYVYKLKK